MSSEISYRLSQEHCTQRSTTLLTGYPVHQRKQYKPMFRHTTRKLGYCSSDITYFIQTNHTSFFPQSATRSQMICPYSARSTWLHAASMRKYLYVTLTPLNFSDLNSPS
ncbi:hypothetical protein EVAR_70399_1 [Eumeta japonica]|uniref:Uncharacterized protein n=1 Tax=Eumeta variegata TaxID=151549 RepID=A0A4C1T0F8_EUMVA|nr:hypothetical protein EVAR_70399_1 [Eumeta japonica]